MSRPKKDLFTLDFSGNRMYITNIPQNTGSLMKIVRDATPETNKWYNELPCYDQMVISDYLVALGQKWIVPPKTRLSDIIETCVYHYGGSYLIAILDAYRNSFMY
jgi:hypothetical protein